MSKQISTILQSAVYQLGAVSDSPQLDAELLLAHVLNLTRTQLLMRNKENLTPDQQQGFTKLLKRRLTGEPIAYLLGYREFWSLSFDVSSDTLIPRPETELLVEWVLQKFPQNTAIKIADLGTGCGAIALAIAHERPAWTVTATDRSSAALAIAQGNAAKLQIHNVIFAQGNWCLALGGERFHAIASNPPYVGINDPHLQQGDVRFEPITALASGDDGLHDLRIIIKEAREHLLPGGYLLLEHGYDQAAQVQALLLAAAYINVESHVDLNGIARVTIGQL